MDVEGSQGAIRAVARSCRSTGITLGVGIVAVCVSLGCWWADERESDRRPMGFLEVAVASTAPCAGCLEFPDPREASRYYSDRKDALRLDASSLDDVDVLEDSAGHFAAVVILTPQGRARVRELVGSKEDALLVTAGSDMPVAVLTHSSKESFVAKGVLLLSLGDAHAMEAFRDRAKPSRAISASAVTSPEQICDITHPADERGRLECVRAMRDSERADSEYRFFTDLDARRRKGEITAEEAARQVEEFERNRRE